MADTGVKFYNEKGKGRKECPKCHKYSGARQTTCQNPKCGYEFPKPASKTAKKKTAEPVLDLLTIAAVNELGGVKGVKAILLEHETALARATEISDKLGTLGGVESATKLLATMEEIHKAFEGTPVKGGKK